jgi:hypothetical protein
LQVSRIGVPFFGRDVDALKPGESATIDNSDLGSPLAHLSDIPAGDYYVQAMFNSYLVNSPNLGPYDDALMQELIPAIEKRFRVISEPYARVVSGGSTGGWSPPICRSSIRRSSAVPGVRVRMPSPSQMWRE